MKIFAKALPSTALPSAGCMVAYNELVTVRKTGKLIPSGRLRVKRLYRVRHYVQMMKAGLQPFVANLMPCCEGMQNAIVESKNFKMLEDKKQVIFFGEKAAVCFYHYPTYTVESSYLYEETANDFHSMLCWEELNGEVTNVVDWVINNACSQLGIRRDNKVAVCCMIEGQFIFYCSFDHRRIICTEINSRNTISTSLVGENIIIPPLNKPNATENTEAQGVT